MTIRFVQSYSFFIVDKRVKKVNISHKILM